MRRILIGVAVSIVCVVGSFGALAMFPALLEPAINLMCSSANPSPRCLVRMRTMGDLWSGKLEAGRAQDWYKRAADRGDVESMFDLAWLYETGGRTRSVAAAQRGLTGGSSGANLQNAILWYERAAGKGLSAAMNNLGEVYRTGTGVSVDPARAFQWHLKAAQAGHPIGILNTSFDYRTGFGVTANIAEAERWAKMTMFAPRDDFGDLQLSRTTMLGAAVPPGFRTEILDALEQRRPIQMGLSEMKADPRLPTFRGN